MLYELVDVIKGGRSCYSGDVHTPGQVSHSHKELVYCNAIQAKGMCWKNKILEWESRDPGAGLAFLELS